MNIQKKIIKSLNHDNSDVKVLTEDLNLTGTSLNGFRPKCKVQLQPNAVMDFDKELVSYVNYGESYTVNARLNKTNYRISKI